MVDLGVVLSKLESIENTQQDQGKTLKDLSKAFTTLAVQNEQISSLQAQCTTMWSKVDKISDHQAHCPKEEMHRTFNWMWGVITIHSALIVGILWSLAR